MDHLKVFFIPMNICDLQNKFTKNLAKVIINPLDLNQSLSSVRLSVFDIVCDMFVSNFDHVEVVKNRITYYSSTGIAVSRASFFADAVHIENIEKEINTLYSF